MEKIQLFFSFTQLITFQLLEPWSTLNKHIIWKVESGQLPSPPSLSLIGWERFKACWRRSSSTDPFSSLCSDSPQYFALLWEVCQTNGPSKFWKVFNSLPRVVKSFGARSPSHWKHRGKKMTAFNFSFLYWYNAFITFWNERKTFILTSFLHCDLLLFSGEI